MLKTFWAWCMFDETQCKYTVKCSAVDVLALIFVTREQYKVKNKKKNEKKEMFSYVCNF
jgi:hypothetical protein